jgi:ubiquinone/menaquinone biosynthesis C-methylase UbiE
MESHPCKTTSDSWNKVAKAYENIFMNLDLCDDTYDAFWSEIREIGAKILEIGCGPGNISRNILYRRPDFKWLGTDLSPAMIELARINVSYGEFEIMDARQISRINQKFEGILCGFRIPYLSRTDCIHLIKDCYELLSSGGVLYLSTIEGSYAHSGFEQGSTGDFMYVYYHSETFIINISQKYSFSLLKFFQKTFTKKNGVTTIHKIYLLKKN